MSRKGILDCDILYSSLMELCVVFKSFKNVITWSLLPVQMKNILSSMNLKELSERPSKDRKYQPKMNYLEHENLRRMANDPIYVINI